MSQKQKVKNYLESGRPLTSWEAIDKWHITRLAAIINVLKNEGMEIKSEMKSDHRTKKPYAEYRCLNIKVNNDQTNLFNDNNEINKTKLPKAQHLERY